MSLHRPMPSRAVTPGEAEDLRGVYHLTLQWIPRDPTASRLTAMEWVDPGLTPDAEVEQQLADLAARDFRLLRTHPDWKP